MGIVHHSNHVRYFELGRIGFLEQHDPEPLQVASLIADADNVTLKLILSGDFNKGRVSK